MARKWYPAFVCVLALVGPAAHALGLGGLRQLSALDQPFVGEIDLIDARPDELDSVKAQIASQAEFTRVGSERYHYLTKLRFSPQVSARGNPVIRVTSREPIREPYMDFLVEVVWPTGRLVRQFTLLLDPPVTSTGGVPRIAAPVLEERSTPRPSTGPAAPISKEAPAQVQAQPGSESYRIPAAATTGGYPKRYGPVRPGVGLWRLARANTPRGATVAQTAMALFRNNQDAFIDGNIQRLSVGRTLTLPHAGELFALSPEAAKREFDAALRGEEVQRNPLVAAPPADTASDTGGPRLRIAAAAEKAAIPAGTRPGPREGGSEAMEKELLLVRETSESAHQETVEMRGRIRELEAQLAEIQQLLKLRNEELARAQGARASVPVGAPGVLGVPQTPRQLAAPGGSAAGEGAGSRGPAPVASGPPADGAATAGGAPTVVAPEVQAGAPAPPTAGTPPQAPPDRGIQTKVTAPETKPPQVQAGGAGPAPGAPKPEPKPPVVEEPVGDSAWLALWLPLVGIVGVTALGIGALAWLRVRRRAERDLGLESAAVEPSEGPTQQPISGRGLAVLGREALGWLRSRTRRGHATGLGADVADQSGEALPMATPKRGLTDLVRTAQRWLHSRLPGGAAPSPESEPDDLSGELAAEVLPGSASALALPDRVATPAPADAGETLIPGGELLTLPRYRLPADQAEAAKVAAEPPPIESVAAGGAEPKGDTEEAISKADVYLAYGRYREAEDVIREEIHHRPGLMELKFKLAMVYEGAGRLDSLRAWMLEMEAAGAEQSNPEDWRRLVERVQGATTAADSDRAPDGGGSLVLDNLDLDLDLDIDELGLVDQFEPASEIAKERQTGEGLPDDTGVKLDLARAYLDMGDQGSARELLEEVVGEGTEAQRAEARDLLRGVV